LTKARYDRLALIYDRLEYLMERRARAWRKRLWDRVEPGKILDAGVGTGKNMPYYPAGAQAFGVDLSSAMLDQARQRSQRDHVEVKLSEMDVQSLESVSQNRGSGSGVGATLGASS